MTAWAPTNGAGIVVESLYFCTFCGSGSGSCGSEETSRCGMRDDDPGLCSQGADNKVASSRVENVMNPAHRKPRVVFRVIESCRESEACRR